MVHGKDAERFSNSAVIGAHVIDEFVQSTRTGDDDRPNTAPVNDVSSLVLRCAAVCFEDLCFFLPFVLGRLPFDDFLVVS